MSQLRAILPYFRPYRAGFVAGLLLVVVANAFGIAQPYLIKLGIDSLGDPDVTSGRIAGYAGLLVLAALLGGAARYGMRELLNGISRRMECDLRDDFFRHLLRLDAGFFNEVRTGDLMSRATNDTQAVRQASGPAVMYTVNTLVGVTFALGLMFWISPRLTLLALIPMLLLPPVVLGFGRVIHRRFERIQEQFSTLSTMVQENLSGVRIVRAYGREREQAGEFEALNAEYMDRNIHLVKAAGLFHPVLSLLTGAAMVVVLWFGGQQVMAGEITVGDFVAFFFYLMLLTWPMIALGWVVNLFQRGAASMGRINRIMETEPRIRAPAHPTPLPPVGREGARVEFLDVAFRYPGSERLVLRDVSFVAEPGQTVAVVGPTGGGKTTLVSLIPRLWDPTDGQVLLNGIPLTELDPADLRRVIGMVPQDPFLFSETIERNIGMGMVDRVGEGGSTSADAERRREEERRGGPAAPGIGRTRPEEGASDRELDALLTGAEDPEEVIVEAARVAQLHESIAGFPRGYGTYLGERGINLSGGQKQRATLARALARDPTILILDDALSAVDTHTEARILEDLRTVMERRTSFIISHRVSAVMNADLILVLDDGRIAERGNHDELIRSGGTYATLLRRQMLEQDLERDVVGAPAD